MTLEFTMKQHFGRADFYPSNDHARLVLSLKQLWSPSEVKALKADELEILSLLGHKIKIVSQTETDFRKFRKIS